MKKNTDIFNEIYLAGRYERIKKFSAACICEKMEEIKSSVSCRDEKYLKKTFKQYGYTGPFTNLDKYFSDKNEMLQTIREFWEMDLTETLNK